MFNGSPILAIEEIKALSEILKENDLGEICIEYKDTKICIKSKREQGGRPQPFETRVQENPVSEVAAPVKENLKTIKAPIVGTFYTSPAPDKPAFVEIGKAVKKGDVIMIIESMKIMNEVTSEFDCIIKDILVKNGEPVEFDQPIFAID